MGKEYLSVLLGLCVFSGIHAILTAVFRSMGRMRLVMANNSLQYIIIIGVYLVTQYLVPREKQSLWQYAMGTIYAQIATITIMLVCLKREGFFGVRLSTEDFTGMLTRWSGRIYYFGIRAGIAPLIAAAVQIVIIRYLGELGTEAMTARTYAVSLTTYLGLFNSTLTTVCSPLAGQYLGAGRINELPHLAHRLMRINLLLTLASCGVMLFAGYPLLHTFTSDEILLKLAFQVLLLDMIWKLISAYGGISVTILRAVGDVNFPFWIGVVAYGINIVISYVCGIRLEMGLIGIWCGFIAADLVNGLMGILRFKSGKWRKTWEKGMFD